MSSVCDAAHASILAIPNIPATRECAINFSVQARVLSYIERIHKHAMGANGESRGSRRARLLGRYAGDKNIEIESKYGQEWLACVMCSFNPVTGVPCVKQNLPRRYTSEMGPIPPTYSQHEYRFDTTSDGWIAGQNSNYANPTAEQSYDGCGPMKCRDCGDVYEPSAEPRQKATLESYMTECVLLNLATARGYGKWVNLSDVTDLRMLVDSAAAMADTLQETAADARPGFASANMGMPMLKIATDIDRWALDMLDDMTQYVKTVRDTYDTVQYKELYKRCREARRVRAAMRRAGRE